MRLALRMLLRASVCSVLAVSWGELAPTLVARSGQTEPAATAQIKIDYPAEGSIFPPDIAAPEFLWRDPDPSAGVWQIEVSFSDGSKRIRVKSSGERMNIGEMDPRCNGETNTPPQLTPEQAAAHTWRPDAKTWAVIKQNSVRGPATITITGVREAAPKQPVSRGSVHKATSKDPVAAPIFYRDVPLMPSELEKGVIKPLSAEAVRYITWRLKNIGVPGSRQLISGFPTCANCHSFSRDGKTIGLDVDGPQNSKGLYALTSVQPKTVIRKQDVIEWSSFKGKLGGRYRVAFMPQVSPDGQNVVATINDPGQDARGAEGDIQGKYYVANFKDYRFLQVFYPTRGILAWYSRATGLLQPLPGADDPQFVQANAAWSPDGKYLVFARAQAKDPYPDNQPMAQFANDPNETQIQYDLYRVPFNAGKGGQAEPLAGASQDGMSNSFPKVSPDGKWIVFVQARNGLLMRPDSELYIVPAEGGTARRLRCNAAPMNSWHSWSPNGRWLVFSSKRSSPYTQMFLTHIDEDGNDSPAILIEGATASNRAVNIPEFVNVPWDGLQSIESPATESYRLFDVAFGLSHKNRHAEAIEEWKKFLELDATEPKAYYNLGVALEAIGKQEEALAQFRKALELNPDEAKARNNLALILAREGKSDEAIPNLEKVLELNPRDAKAHSNLGGILAEKGDLSGAIAHFSAALELDSDDMDARNNLAVVLLKAGRPDDAIPHFKLVLAADPSLVETHYTLALALASTRRWGEAVAQFEQVLALKPDHAKAHAALGSALAEQGRLDEAITHYGSALAADPHDAQVHNNLGIALARQGKLADAIGHFEQALAGSGESVETHVNLGLALAQLGRLQESIPHFEKALAADPGNAQLHDYLGRALAATGRAAEAIPHFEQALPAAPDSPNAHYSLGSALYDGRGDVQAALGQWREALRLAPNHVPAMNRIARVLACSPDASLRNGGEAVQLAERAVQGSGGGEAEFLDTLAAAYAEVGRFPEAVQTARRALDLAGQSYNRPLAGDLAKHLALYEAKTPLREPPKNASASRP